MNELHLRPVTSLHGAQSRQSRRDILLRSLLATVLVGAMLSGCAFPRKEFLSVPDPSVISVPDGTGQRQALPPDCERLREPSQYSTLTDPRMDIAFGCATYTNLSRQVARPEDLVRPRSHGNQSADTAAAAVQRHRTGNITPLRGTTATDVSPSK